MILYTYFQKPTLLYNHPVSGRAVVASAS